MGVLCVGIGTLPAQVQNSNIRPKINSPLSRYGLGDLVDPYFVASAGMGGLSATWQDPYHLNFVNPAALASLQATAFEGGLYAQYSNLKGKEASDQLWGGNLRYLALGFPLKNPINRALDRQSNDWGVGMGFQLAPLTQVGYDINVAISDPDLGRVTNTLKGAGGAYRLQWGNAVRYKNLSVGANLGYLFGELTNSRLVTFDSLSYSLETEFSDQINLRGFGLEGGAQYVYDFKKTNAKGEIAPSGERIIVGVYGTAPSDFTTQVNKYYRRFYASVSDTLTYESAEKGTGSLPGSITAGLAYQKLNKFLIGLEYNQTGWGDYTNSSKDESLADTWRVTLGAEYIPNYISYNNYWSRMRYRLGFYYGTDPRSIGTEQVTRYALTLGTGFPIVLPRQQVSFMNTALEIGRFGVPDVLQETFVKLSVGFTLNDNSWFFKRKFN